MSYYFIQSREIVDRGSLFIANICSVTSDKDVSEEFYIDNHSSKTRSHKLNINSDNPGILNQRTQSRRIDISV